MASTYSDINYNVDPTLKDSEHGHGIMNGVNVSESALLDYVDGFPTKNESTADFRVEEITEITIERVPVPQVVVKVEPLTEFDSGVHSQVSLSEHEEEEQLLSKEIVVCEVHSSSEPVPENSLVHGKDGVVKFEIKDSFGSDSHEEDIHIISTEPTDKIEKRRYHNPPQTTFFYERMLLESQSSASFNMDDIYSSCTSSSDDSQDSYLYQRHMTSMDTVCQSLLPWRRHDDYEAIEKVDDEKASDDKKKENWCRVLLEIGLPFLMSGFGCIGAGYVLDKVQHWIVFVKVSEIFILVPALLGLKGNLEMTLASRLSTQANIGNMDDRREQWKMIGGNLALTQAQAVVVGFLAALAAMLLAWIPEGKFDIHHAFLLCASSVLTAALASFILGSVMIIVVLLSRKCNINPDNVATPIAASLGDLTTLALLSTLANFFWVSLGSSKVWIAPTALALCLLLTPLWCYISYRNKYVKEVLISGWTPVIGAMMISSFGGLILDFAVASYHGIAVFQPVVNGVGGNLVAVQASRLSTSLHQRSKPGVLPEDAVHGCPNPCWTFFGKGSAGRTARVLLLMVIPGHLIFIYTISFMQAGHTSITPIFAAVYLTAATLQVVVLLYTSNWLVHWLWKRGNDPDNFSIPYLTALGDLLGGALLAIAFHILYVVGDKDSDGFL